MPPREPCAFPPIGRPVIGGPYTLGNDGAVAEVGLEPPVSPVELSGESGLDNPELWRAASVIRDKENVRSSDCARLVNERGFDDSESFNLDSNNESEPRFNASSACLVRLGTPEPW